MKVEFEGAQYHRGVPGYLHLREVLLAVRFVAVEAVLPGRAAVSSRCTPSEEVDMGQLVDGCTARMVSGDIV